MSGQDSASGRDIQLTSTWTGSGTRDASVGMFTNNGSNSALFSVKSNAAGGIMNFVLPAYKTTMQPTMWQFDNDFQLRIDNSTTTGMPFMRSDGNYLVINSRPAANGGALYLNHDNSADIYLGFAGGTQYLYNPNFVSSAPEWAAALAQTTVGAAGAASALPATPAGYIKIRVTGVGTFVVPAYNP